MSDRTKRLRMAAAKKSTWHFAHAYFRFEQDLSPFQKEYMDALDEALKPGGRLIAILPREHGKSTLGTLVFLCRVICLGLKVNIHLFAATEREGEGKLRDITMEFDNNERLQEDYGYRIQPARDQQGLPLKRTSDERIFQNGVRVKVIPFGGVVRGTKHNDVRIDLAFMDDAESDAKTNSPTDRERLWSWLNGAMLNALHTGKDSVIWPGTLVHPDALLERARQQKKNWKVIEYPAIIKDADGKDRPLWPEKFTMQALELKRAEIGEVAWWREWMHVPQDPGEQRFPPDRWQRFNQANLVQQANRWHIRVGGLVQDLHPLSIYFGIDPAIGGTKKHDFFAWFVIGRDPLDGEKFYLLEVGRRRGMLPDCMNLVANRAQHWRPTIIGFESEGFQVLAAQKLIDYGMAVREVKHRSNKESRIEAIAVFHERGQLYIPKDDSPAFKDFIDEAAMWPKSPHDDQMDALTIAMEMATTTGAVGRIVVGGRNKMSGLMKGYRHGT